MKLIALSSLLALWSAVAVCASLTLSAWAVTTEARVTLARVPNGGIQPEAAMDAAGALHLIYFSGDPHAGDVYYVRSTDFGETFSKPIRVNSNPAAQSPPGRSGARRWQSEETAASTSRGMAPTLPHRKRHRIQKQVGPVRRCFTREARATVRRSNRSGI